MAKAEVIPVPNGIIFMIVSRKSLNNAVLLMNLDKLGRDDGGRNDVALETASVGRRDRNRGRYVHLGVSED
jgi:hypothetical protein